MAREGERREARAEAAVPDGKANPGATPASAPFQLPVGLRAYYGLPIQADAERGPAADPRAAFRRATSGAAQPVPFRGEMEASFGRDFSQVRTFPGQSEAMGSIG